MLVRDIIEPVPDASPILPNPEKPAYRRYLRPETDPPPFRGWSVEGPLTIHRRASDDLSTASRDRHRFYDSPASSLPSGHVTAIAYMAVRCRPDQVRSRDRPYAVPEPTCCCCHCGHCRFNGWECQPVAVSLSSGSSDLLCSPPTREDRASFLELSNGLKSLGGWADMCFSVNIRLSFDNSMASCCAHWR